MVDAFDLNEEQPTPNAFIQWKGTDVCMDFRCDCGANCHFDGYFAYVVKCPHCGTKWQMPSHIYPRKATAENAPWHFDSENTLEPDEDYSDEVTGRDGITVLVAKPVSP